LTGADLAGHLGLPVLLVARSALGTINHTALSMAELRRREIEIAGVLLVQTQAAHAPHEDTNAPLIQQLTGLAPLGILPHLPQPATDPDALASALAQAVGSEALDRLLFIATGAPTGSRPRA